MRTPIVSRKVTVYVYKVSVYDKPSSTVDVRDYAFPRQMGKAKLNAYITNEDSVFIEGELIEKRREQRIMSLDSFYEHSDLKEVISTEKIEDEN